MIADQTPALADRHAVILPLAAMLQKLDMSSVAVDPAQYRSVVKRLSELLAATSLDPRLDGILGAYPAAAELYENLQYEHAGLCRSPLEASVDSEQRVKKLFAKVTGN